MMQSSECAVVHRLADERVDLLKPCVLESVQFVLLMRKAIT